MSVRKEIPVYDGIFFITFTNARWLRLFEISNAYDSVYKWFDHLKAKGHYIVGYVIMPNHVHLLIGFRNTQGQSINRIIAEGKRFMAYDIVKRLKAGKQLNILSLLKSYVNRREASCGKIHKVFEPSFDWKECMTTHFITQKLDYIHNNPCQGKWDLAKHPTEYVHSSALYYATGLQGMYPVTSFAELDDIDLTKPQID